MSDNTCCFCDEGFGLFHGKPHWGNNAQPVADGQCCDDCNYSVVLPARLAEMFGGRKDIAAQAAAALKAVADQWKEPVPAEERDAIEIVEPVAAPAAAEEEDDEEDDDGWEEVYQVVEGVDELLPESSSLRDHSAYNRFRTTADSKTTYYQTYGGGPEGGYFVTREKPDCATGCGCELTVYSVKRGWYEPWSISLLPGYTLDFKEADEAAGKPARLLITTPHGAW